MLTYKVRRASKAPALDGKWDSADWKNAAIAELTNFRKEGSDHKPKVQAKLLWTERAIHGLFKVEDRYVRAVITDYQGSVCTDSCAEFFFKPKMDKGYFNLEMNCGGTILISYITDHTRAPDGFRKFIRLPKEDGDAIKIYHSMPSVVEPEVTDPVTWYVGFSVPLKMLEKYVGSLSLKADDIWTANFYKCADRTSHPHWASWSPVDELNFHLPRCFGQLEFC